MNISTMCLACLVWTMSKLVNKQSQQLLKLMLTSLIAFYSKAPLAISSKQEFIRMNWNAFDLDGDCFIFDEGIIKEASIIDFGLTHIQITPH